MDSPPPPAPYSAAPLVPLHIPGWRHSQPCAVIVSTRRWLSLEGKPIFHLPVFCAYPESGGLTGSQTFIELASQ